MDWSSSGRVVFTIFRQVILLPYWMESLHFIPLAYYQKIQREHAATDLQPTGT